MARYVERLNQLASAAGVVADLTRATLVNRFTVTPGAHLYLHTAHADLRITRHDSAEIVITAHIQPPFAWQIVGEQDESGAYYVALRKPLLGVVGSGRFEVLAPYSTPIILRLERVRVTQDDLTGTLDLPAPVRNVIP